MIKFKCYRCIHCCFFVTPNDYPVLLKEEVNRLRNLAKKYNVNVTFKKINDIFYMWVINGFCPFYDVKERRCLIHNEKPLSCKIFPLLLNIKTREISASMMCDWVAKNIKVITNLNLQEVFPDEVKALIELYKRIVVLRGGGP